MPKAWLAAGALHSSGCSPAAQAEVWNAAFPSQEGPEPAQLLLGMASAELTAQLLPTSTRAFLLCPHPCCGSCGKTDWCWSCRTGQPGSHLSPPLLGQQPLTPALRFHLHPLGQNGGSYGSFYTPSVPVTPSVCLQGLLAWHEATNTSLDQGGMEGWMEGWAQSWGTAAHSSPSPEERETQGTALFLCPPVQLPQPHISVQVPGVRALCHPREPLVPM